MKVVSILLNSLTFQDIGAEINQVFPENCVETLIMTHESGNTFSKVFSSSIRIGNV